MMEKIQLNQGISLPPQQTFSTDIYAVGKKLLHLGIRRQAENSSRLLGDPHLTALSKAGLSSLGSSHLARTFPFLSFPDASIPSSQ